MNRSYVTATTITDTGELFFEPAQEPVKHRFAVLFIDCFGQRNVHGTGLDTILGVATVGDPIIPHYPFQPLIAVHHTRRMHVEEAHLGNRLWPDVVILVVLGTGFQATPAGHTTGIRVALHYVVLIHARTRTEII